jgi:hypothetical protein
MSGMSLADATVWSLIPSQLGSLLIPNYLLPLSAGLYWDLGFFFGSSYFLSHYLGVTLLLLIVYSWAGPGKWRGLFWLIFSWFGLAMILGNNLGVYAFFYKYFPGFNLFRFPEKFFLFLNFGFVLLAVYGYEFLSGRKQSFPGGAWVSLLTAAVIIVLLFIYPLRTQEFGNDYHAVARYLFWRNILRISVFFLMGLGLVLLVGRVKVSWLGLGLALVLFLDLFFAHHRLNPVTTKEFFRPNEFVREFLAKEKNRIVPPRIFSVLPPKQDLIVPRQTDALASFKVYPNSLQSGWGVYFGLNNIRWPGGTFYPREVDKFEKLLSKAKWPQNDLILARAGVEYLYYPERGFTRIPDPFPRAMIFYRAQTLSDRDQIIRLWADPEFPAEQMLLVESKLEKSDTGSERIKSEPARIVEYQNERVTVETQAREDAWLLLLDTYYPGWKAEVDGRPVEIIRADGFFRAVKIPEGKHKIVFNYFPAIFKKSVWVSSIGFLIWLGLIIFTCIRGKEKEKAI